MFQFPKASLPLNGHPWICSGRQKKEYKKTQKQIYDQWHKRPLDSLLPDVPVWIRAGDGHPVSGHVVSPARSYIVATLLRESWEELAISSHWTRTHTHTQTYTCTHCIHTYLKLQCIHNWCDKVALWNLPAEFLKTSTFFLPQRQVYHMTQNFYGRKFQSIWQKSSLN